MKRNVWWRFVKRLAEKYASERARYDADEQAKMDEAFSDFVRKWEERDLALLLHFALLEIAVAEAKAAKRPVDKDGSAPEQATDNWIG
jgi:hypothetical protein